MRICKETVINEEERNGIVCTKFVSSYSETYRLYSLEMNMCIYICELNGITMYDIDNELGNDSIFLSEGETEITYEAFLEVYDEAIASLDNFVESVGVGKE